MDVSEKKERFFLSTKKLINRISVSLTGSEIFNAVSEKSSMDEGFLYIKTELLKRLNLNIVVPEGNVADVTGVHNGQNHFSDIVRDFNKEIFPIREDLIKATNKQELLEALEKSSASALKTYRELTKNDKRLGKNPVSLCFLEKYYDIGAGNPAKLIEKITQSYEDKKSSGFEKFKDLSEDINYLKTVGLPIQLQDNFQEVQKKVNELGARFGVSFFEFPLSQDRKEMLSLLNSFSKKSEDFANRMGMEESCVGMQDNLGFSFNVSNAFEGRSMTVSKKIELNSAYLFDTIKIASYSPSTLAHEWIHSLDANLMLEAKEYLRKNHEDFFNNSKIAKFFHVSNLEVSIPEDSSKYLQRIAPMKKFINDAISGNLDVQKKYQEEVMQSEVAGVMFSVLGESYFLLPESQRMGLHEPYVVDAVRNKMLNPTNPECSNMLKSLILWNVTASGFTDFDRERIDERLAPENADKYFKYGIEKISQIEKYKFAGESEIVLSSRLTDTKINNGVGLLASQKEKPKDSTALVNSDYYQSNVEVIARYTESNLYPEMRVIGNSGVLKGCEIYLTKKDANFDKNRRELLSSVFGSENVKDMDVTDPYLLKKIAINTGKVLFRGIARSVESFNHLVKSVENLKKSYQAETNISLSLNSQKKEGENIELAKKTVLKIIL